MLGSSISLAFAGASFIWAAYVAVCLAANYLRARKTGIPIVVLPIDSGNPLWMSIDTKVLPLFRKLPFGFGNFTRFNYRGWEIKDRYHAHQELGDAFIFVTPGKNWLQLCNAAAISEIYQRRDDFTRPTEMLAMLNIFGPNLGTTEGQQWQRHRKITVTCFNEQNNELVWSESIKQATGMLRYWSSQPSVTTVADDTRTLSLHVMSSAAFGKSYPYRGDGEVNEKSGSGSANIKDALQTILDNCIPLVALGPGNLGKPWLPKSWHNLHQATITFREYMTSVYEEQKQASQASDKGSNNLMSTLVRASQANTSTKEGDKQSSQGLTEKEVYGNMFVFNFAGHDTTANSLAFGMVLLAARLDVQDWLAEEIKAVFGDAAPSVSSYNDMFPKLKRCLAVAHETIRLYTPVAIVKTSGPQPQPLTINDKTVVLPPHTMIIPNYSALHTHPRHWGENSLAFEPRRWITSDASAAIGEETFLEFPRNSSPFIGWSGGARVCPGKKFSQVEFVGVLVGLFRNHRVKPVLRPGENDAMARKRLEQLLIEDAGMKLLLQLMHPEKAVLRWEKQ